MPVLKLDLWGDLMLGLELGSMPNLEVGLVLDLKMGLMIEPL